MIENLSPVRKWVADLEGTELVLPPEVDTRDYIVSFYERETGVEVSFQALGRHRDKIVWQRWVKDPHGYPGAQDPREEPAGHWEGYEIAPDKYRAVVVF